jgi:hypothetical protein
VLTNTPVIKLVVFRLLMFLELCTKGCGPEFKKSSKNGGRSS